MKSIAFARWEIECDPVATRESFRRVHSGAPEACGCAPCRNFAAARAQVYPLDVLQLFDSLAVQRDREAEIYHTHRIGPRRHGYGGWFHFVARIVSGLDACKQVSATKHGPVWGFDLEKISAEFELGLTQQIGLLREPFRGHPVVQIEFKATVPWVLTEEEPVS